MKEDNKILASKISKTYGSKENSVHALKETSLSIESGEFVAVLGTSGCGKSTLLHVIGGIDEPDSGRVVIHGKEIYKMKRGERSVFRRRHIGMIYQSIYLLPYLNVEENIVLPLLLDGKELSKKRLEKLLEETGLTGKRESLPCQLSGGQQQRAAIARAIAASPAVILADEPTGSLDKKNRNIVMNLLKKLNRIYNITILMVTHDEELAKQCDRILIWKTDGLSGTGNSHLKVRKIEIHQ